MRVNCKALIQRAEEPVTFKMISLENSNNNNNSIDRVLKHKNKIGNRKIPNKGEHSLHKAKTSKIIRNSIKIFNKNKTFLRTSNNKDSNNINKRRDRMIRISDLT